MYRQKKRADEDSELQTKKLRSEAIKEQLAVSNAHVRDY